MPRQPAQEYQVEKVIDKRIVHGITEYKVLWKGYYEHQATWQPQDCLEHSKKLIKIYEKEEKLKRKRIINQKAVQLKQIELSSDKYKLIKSFSQLEKLFKEKPIFHNPVQLAKMGKSRQPVITFECLLSKPPNQMLKVQRYDAIKGQFKQKLESCSQIIAKVSTRQKNQLRFSQTPITIDGISTDGNQYIVHFVFRQESYKCQLNMLRLVKPHEIIEYFLQRYDPSENKTKKSREVNQYLKKHPQEKKLWSD